MPVTRRTCLQLAAAGAALPWHQLPARAQDYPASPVRLLVGFPPGGPTDITARVLVQALADQLGGQFIVENRPGAGSNIATGQIAHGSSDGSSLLLVTTANAINATLYRKLDFDFMRDIAPIASVIRYPLVMLVHPSVPAKTVPEFIAYAKANPGKLNMGSGSTGSPFHVAGELFKMMAGVDMLHVPYRGSAPMLAAMLAGQVQVAFDAMASSIAYVEAGSLRALAVTTAERSAALPDVPPVAASVPGYEASGWHGVGAHRNTPDGIIERLNRQINLALSDEKVQAIFGKLGSTVFPQSVAAFAKFVAAETEKWGRVVRFSGATVD